mmetsp:Transcript_28408/g.68955  ORF Transcript_28408/g.68955 Transcript_28408/m.68955 type:complete len:135 (+) Transcript_28408:168-572(+)
MSSKKMERKCFGDVTNQVSAASNSTAATQRRSSALDSMTELEQKVIALNDRLDVLGAKFESLISNVQRQNQEVSSLMMIPTIPSSGAVADCSSSTHTPSSSHQEERSMKELVKRSILGDESYSIYRKTLKPNRQ